MKKYFPCVFPLKLVFKLNKRIKNYVSLTHKSYLRYKKLNRRNLMNKTLSDFTSNKSSSEQQ